MRRLRRWMLDALTLLSLLLCVAATGMWVRSSATDRPFFYAVREHTGFAVVAYNGSITATCESYAEVHSPVYHTNLFRQSQISNDPSFWFAVSGDPLLDFGEKGRLGFNYLASEGWFTGIREGRPPPDFRFRSVTLPCWVSVAVFMLLPVLRVLRMLSVRRTDAEGRCYRCHYDLTGNVSGVCPECGSKIDGDK